MFLLSLLALALGALACLWLDNNPNTHKTVDGLVMGLMLALLGVVLFADILPETGWLGGLLLIAGFLTPYLLEHGFHRFARQAHLLTLVVGLVGLMLHATLDGAGLVPAQHGASDHAEWLAWAIIIHRLPVGMMTWWLLGPQFGWKPAALALAGMGFFTFIGYTLAGEVLTLDHEQLGLLEALVTGSLLHVILNKRHADKHAH